MQTFTDNVVKDIPVSEDSMELRQDNVVEKWLFINSDVC